MYKNVKIEWIRHHNPDLEIFDERGKVLRKIDLSAYDFNGLHVLFSSYFAKAKAGGSDRRLSDHIIGGDSAAEAQLSRVTRSASVAAASLTTLRPDEAAIPNLDSVERQAVDNNSVWALSGSKITWLGILLLGTLGLMGGCILYKRTHRTVPAGDVCKV